MINVLVVDDSPITRRAQRRMLTIAKVPLGNVAEAADGIEAIEELRKARYDLVLCDLNMPNMGGVAVLTAIKKDPTLKNPKVIFVSSDHTEERRERLIAAGAAAYVHKPLDPEKLVETLRTVMPRLWETP